MEWHVDDSRISLRARLLKLEIVVDDSAVATIPNDVGGRFGIPWKERDVELRRVGPSSGLESVLYVDGVLVPTSTDGPVRGKAAPCGAHRKKARRRCPSCDAVACPACLSVDGVRCAACLEAASSHASGSRRRSWLIGAAVCALLAVGGGIAMLTSDSDLWSKVAGTFVFATLFMIYVGMRSYDGASLPRIPTVFEVDDEAPQITGARCRACKAHVGTANAGTWCRGCRHVLHATCAKDHDCRPAKRGPDWDALRATT